jgi:hypothetical protein
MKRFALAIVAGVLLLVIFSPPVMPLYWHLRYGEAMEFQGRRVPVPRHWYPKREFRSLDLVKPPLTVFSLVNPPPVWSFIGPLGGAPPVNVDEAYRSFETYYQENAVRTEQIMSEPMRIGNGEYQSVCIKRSPERSRERSAVSCELFAGTWMGEFVGPTDEVENFLQVIRGMAEK